MAERRIEGIGMEKLLKIKESVETRKNQLGRDSSSVEFVWTYEPGKGVREVETVYTSAMSAIMQILGGAVETRIYKNTQALADIHNHPSGKAIPSDSDITRFLSLASFNQNLRYAIIVPSKDRIVRGFYVLEYRGDRTSLLKKEVIAKQEYHLAVQARQDEIKQHPEKFAHLRWGGSIFSVEEHLRIIGELMKLVEIGHFPIPLSGHKFCDWEFKQED